MKHEYLWPESLWDCSWLKASLSEKPHRGPQRTPAACSGGTDDDLQAFAGLASEAPQPDVRLCQLRPQKQQWTRQPRQLWAPSAHPLSDLGSPFQLPPQLGFPSTKCCFALGSHSSATPPPHASAWLRFGLGIWCQLVHTADVQAKPTPFTDSLASACKASATSLSGAQAESPSSLTSAQTWSIAHSYEHHPPPPLGQLPWGNISFARFPCFSSSFPQVPVTLYKLARNSMFAFVLKQGLTTRLHFFCHSVMKKNLAIKLTHRNVQNAE